MNIGSSSSFDDYVMRTMIISGRHVIERNLSHKRHVSFYLPLILFMLFHMMDEFLTPVSLQIVYDLFLSLHLLRITINSQSNHSHVEILGIFSRQASLTRHAFLITALHGARYKTGKNAYAKK